MSLILSSILIPLHLESKSLGLYSQLQPTTSLNNTLLTLRALGSTADALQCTCPDTRSILDIIWSCLATMFLCTWVSVHPNLGPPKELKIMSFVRRVKVMLWGLLGPDIILFWSMAQWFAARNAAKKYADRGWTMTHGFFLGMGGFALYRGEEELGTLTKEMFDELEAAGEIVFPSITQEEIEDKSKGDPLTKALVVLQTLWFITQSIARGVTGLAMTELEVLTLAFCGLNGVMYFFWWYKPLDVQCHVPVYLKPESRYTIARPVKRARVINLSDRDTVEALNTLGGNQPRGKSELSQIYVRGRKWLKVTKDKVSLALFKLRFEIVGGFRSTYDVDTRTWGKLVISTIMFPPLVALCLILLPFFLAGLVLFAVIYPSGWMTFQMVDIISVGDPFVMVTKYDGQIVPKHNPAADFPVPEDFPTFYSPVLSENPLRHMFIIYSLFGLSGGIFGGLHCIAWNFHFPTRAELYIWRATSLYLTVAPVFYSLFENVDPLIEKVISDEDGTLRSWSMRAKNTAIKVYNFIYDVGEICFYFLFCFYVPIRLMILAQGFILLRDLPPSAFLEIDWQNFVPHL